jgi:hypothetical protein
MKNDERLRLVFTRVANDIVDNLEKYKIRDKLKVLELLVKMMKVNKQLEQYDKIEDVPPETPRDENKYSDEVEGAEKDEKTQNYWH